MTEFLNPDVLNALFQVILVDLVLAGDNAIIIGLAAAGLATAEGIIAVFLDWPASE